MILQNCEKFSFVKKIKINKKCASEADKLTQCLKKPFYSVAEIRCASCTNVNITCKELMFICVRCWSGTPTQHTDDPSTLSEACPNDALARDQICRYESDVYYSMLQHILASRRCGLLRHATPVRG